MVHWDMDKWEIRRQRLLALLKEQCDDKRSVLAERLDRNPSYVSRMLYPHGKAGKKRIGEDMVALVAEKFGGYSLDAGENASAPVDQQILAAIKRLSPIQRETVINVLKGFGQNVVVPVEEPARRSEPIVAPLNETVGKQSSRSS